MQLNLTDELPALITKMFMVVTSPRQSSWIAFIHSGSRPERAGAVCGSPVARGYIHNNSTFLDYRKEEVED
jgi:hypothetical protein